MNINQQSELMHIYQHLEKSKSGPGGLLIQLVSCHPGEGTSTVAQGIAKTCTNILGKSVVILGGDVDSLALIQNGKINKVGSKPNNIEGLLPVPGQQFFYLLTPSLKSTDRGMLACSDIIQNEACAKDAFDLTLVDAPPLSVASICLSVARHADGVLLVVEAEKTRWPDVIKAKDDISGAGGILLGVVLNKRRNYIPSWFSRVF